MTIAHLFLYYYIFIFTVHYTTSCIAQSNAPLDGQNNCPKHVELIGYINKQLLLHLVGCLLYYLYQWCMVKQILNVPCRFCLNSFYKYTQHQLHNDKIWYSGSFIRPHRAMFITVTKAQQQDLRFSQPHCIWLESSGMWHNVSWQVVPGVSKDHGACSPRISRHHDPSNCWHPLTQWQCHVPENLSLKQWRPCEKLYISNLC
jgi:hypothetical protein